MSSPSIISQHVRLLYTSRSLADALGVSESQIRTWVNQGKLPYRKGALLYPG